MKNIVNQLLFIAKSLSKEEVTSYENEFYDEEPFDSLLPSSLKPEEYFQILKEVCMNYQEFKQDSSCMSGYIYLLETLTKATKTTEVPQGMNLIIKDNPGDSEFLRNWYRKSG